MKFKQALIGFSFFVTGLLCTYLINADTGFAYLIGFIFALFCLSSVVLSVDQQD